MGTALTEADVCRALGVSRETCRRLAAHLDLVRKWQPRINLVGQGTLDDPWRRHILDSGQLLAYLPPGARTLVDLGSGAGFPGLVLAILGVPEVHLVEADRRKAAFLREAARAAGVRAAVHAGRLENLEDFPADVVTARALAPLDRLLALAAPFLARGAVGIFPKGRTADEELTAARRTWKMAAARHPSRTDPAAAILVIRNARRHARPPA